jgi:O-Antigen ligase
MRVLGGRTEWSAAALPGLLAFASVGLTAAVNGGYFPSEWGWPTLAFLLVLLLAVLLGDAVAVGRLELLMLGLLAGFAAWTFLSAAWLPGTTPAVRAGELVCVYVSGLAAAFLVTTRRAAPWLAAGVLAAATAVAVYAVGTHLGDAAAVRLTEPIGYTNALGMLMAIGALVSLGLAAGTLPASARALAAAPVPLLLTVLYFTFSRGSWLGLAAGICLAVAFARRRLRYLATAAALATPAALAVAAASHSHAYGLGAVVAACVAASAAIAWLLSGLERRIDIGARARTWIGGGIAAAVALVVLAGIVRAGGPVAIASDATRSFRADLPDTGSDLHRRLVSLSGDGRGEYWRVAWLEVRAHPVLGGGAGSYEDWWHRERHVRYQARNAHNLYLETLAEVGPFGLLLLAAALVIPLVAAARVRDAAGTGAYCAFLVHSGVDWDWQLPAVAFAGLLCGASILVAVRPDAARRPLTPGLRSALLAVILPLVVLAVIEQMRNT